MSLAVPIILAVALATSLYGQAGTEWPNYVSEQNEKSDKGGEDSSKDKSDKKSSEKSKSAQKEAHGKSGNSSKAPSKGRRDAEPRRQE